MWNVAQIQHPNIVGVVDAGEIPGTDQDSPTLHYFVMEYVPAQDLQEYVETHGPLQPVHACNLIHQLASALVETDKHRLIHRDIKPSNIIVTPEGVAKLLDFGLARQFRSSATVPGSALGTIDYLAPEQARDASSVDIRADLYSLGGVLFWCLTGQTPFPSEGNAVQDLLRRLTQPPPSVRTFRPQTPGELDAVVTRMMALEPGDRFLTPQAVMQSLRPFLKSHSSERAPQPVAQATCEPHLASPEEGPVTSQLHRVLIVDDEPNLRQFLKHALQSDGVQCTEAANGVQALKSIANNRYDLVLSDIDMPEMTGLELLQGLRETPPCDHLKIILISGRASPNEMAQMLSSGVDDFLTKPLSLVQLRARVKAALRLKDAQDRLGQLNRNMLATNQQLEQDLTAHNPNVAAC
jgi:serine/threonine protein kinase